MDERHNTEVAVPIQGKASGRRLIVAADSLRADVPHLRDRTESCPEPKEDT